MITIATLLDSVDTQTSLFKVSPTIHGWRIINRNIKCDVIINRADMQISHPELLALRKTGMYEHLIVLALLSETPIDLTRLTKLVYEECIPTRTINVRYATSYQIHKVSRAYPVDKDSYIIKFPTPKGVGEHVVPDTPVLVLDESFATLSLHLSEISSELNEFKRVLRTGTAGLNVKAHGITIYDNILCDVDSVIKRQLPDLYRKLTIEEDVMTLRLLNVSFEVSRFGKMDYVNMFGKYELDGLRDVDHLVELTSPALILFINAINNKSCLRK